MERGLLDFSNDGWDRDMILPFARRVQSGQPVRGGGLFGSDWHFAVPQALADVGNAATAMHANVLGGKPIATDDMIGHAGAVVGPMVAVGMGRAMMAPRGSSELGIFGGRLAKTADHAPKPAAEIIPGIRAFHGSPHDFDRFDISKIGTGEGAQAYGHGLYFAESEGVAKSYRDALTNPKIDGLPINPDNPFHWLALAIDEAGGDKGKAFAALQRWHMSSSRMEDRIAIKSAINRFSDVPTISEVTDRGRMYEVNIKANPEEFLDWDKPLSQQNEKVRRIAAQTIDGLDPTSATDVISSQPIYSLIAKQPESVAEMRKAGIPGVKYFDAGSRTHGEGSRNYVVFDDALIEILRKYGLIPPAAAAGLLAGMGTEAEAAPRQ